MTQKARTTESKTTDHAAIRGIMHQARDRLTVPDRAKLAVGLIGHLATFMNRRQMERLLDQLREEAERVQDVPPRRVQEDLEAEIEARLFGGEPAAKAGRRGKPPEPELEEKFFEGQ